MKTLITRMLTLFVLILLLISCQQSVGSSYRTTLKLNGSWKFNIGDDTTWASPNFDDKEWESIMVPGKWEEQGYVGYDGFAWYRKTIMLPTMGNSKTLFLHLGRIDDADEVYLNGKLIGKTGEFPPHYASAYDWDRDYVVPFELLMQNAENVIAIRVYDAEGEGGFMSNKVSLRINEDEDLLDLNLAGNWKFKLYDDDAWKEPGFNDASWESLRVPMSWESQNHFDFDGYAWYRKTFTLPSELKNKELYLVMGKIDDYDRVYLNGESIGEVSPKRVKNQVSTWNGNEYNTPRIYKIPSDLLKDSVNSISVRVYDQARIGGIYEGPIGIMEKKHMREYKSHRYENEGEKLEELLGLLFGDKDKNEDF